MDKSIKLKEIISCIKDNKEVFRLIKTRPYIPIMEKDIICRKYMLEKSLKEETNEDPVSLSIELEILWKFEIVFKYTNVEVEEDDKTFENYDLLMSSGVFDFISKKCSYDMKKIGDLIKNACGVSDMIVVTQILKSANGTDIKKSIEEFKNVVGDKNIVDGISKILAFNDPAINQAIHGK